MGSKEQSYHGGQRQEPAWMPSGSGRVRRGGLVGSAGGIKRWRMFSGNRLRDCHPYRSDEPVAAPGNGLNVPGSVRVVVQGRPDLADAMVKATFEVNKDVAAPELLLDFLAGDEFAGARCQQHEKSEWLRLQADGDAEFLQLIVVSIELEDTECEDRQLGHSWVHSARAAWDLTWGIDRRIIDAKLLIPTLNRRVGADSWLRSSLDNSVQFPFFVEFEESHDAVRKNHLINIALQPGSG